LHPTPPLFPYTTLFRSGTGVGLRPRARARGCYLASTRRPGIGRARPRATQDSPDRARSALPRSSHRTTPMNPDRLVAGLDIGSRSEEHTSELQSRSDLV